MSTVYRTLESLEAWGLVEHVHRGHGAAFFTSPRRIRTWCARSAAGCSTFPPTIRRARRTACGTSTGSSSTIAHNALMGRCLAHEHVFATRSDRRHVTRPGVRPRDRGILHGPRTSAYVERHRVGSVCGGCGNHALSRCSASRPVVAAVVTTFVLSGVVTVVSAPPPSGAAGTRDARPAPDRADDGRLPAETPTSPCRGPFPPRWVTRSSSRRASYCATSDTTPTITSDPGGRRLVTHAFGTNEGGSCRASCCCGGGPVLVRLGTSSCRCRAARRRAT